MLYITVTMYLATKRTDPGELLSNNPTLTKVLIWASTSTAPAVENRPDRPSESESSPESELEAVTDRFVVSTVEASRECMSRRSSR